MQVTVDVMYTNSTIIFGSSNTVGVLDTSAHSQGNSKDSNKDIQVKQAREPASE